MWSLKCWHHGGISPSKLCFSHSPLPETWDIQDSFKFPTNHVKPSISTGPRRETDRGAAQTGRKSSRHYHPASSAHQSGVTEPGPAGKRQMAHSSMAEAGITGGNSEPAAVAEGSPWPVAPKSSRAGLFG